jgi:putative ATP-binding cassette transporter
MRTDPSAGGNVPPAASTGIEREPAIARGEAAGAVSARAERRVADQARSQPDGNIAEELYLLFREMLRGGRGWPILRLWIAIVAVLVGNMVGQVRLNEWNGAFFDAVERRNSEAFLWQLVVFLVIVAGLLVLVVAQTWFQERFSRRRFWSA